MYSTNNERKSVVAEKFIKTVKNKIFRHMTAASKEFILMFYIMMLTNTIANFIERL